MMKKVMKVLRIMDKVINIIIETFILGFILCNIGIYIHTGDFDRDTIYVIIAAYIATTFINRITMNKILIGQEVKSKKRRA